MKYIKKIAISFVVGIVIVFLGFLSYVLFYAVWNFFTPTGYGVGAHYNPDNDLAVCGHSTFLSCKFDFFECEPKGTTFSFGGTEVSCCPRNLDGIPENNRCVTPETISDVVPTPVP